MKIKNKAKIGTKLVEAGRVYRVFKIEQRKVNGKTERIIHYKPFFKDSINSTLVCSIPEANLFNSNIRMPVAKKEMVKIFSRLSKKTNKIKVVDVIKAKTKLNLNDINVTATILRRCWREKKRQQESFTKTKKDLLKLALSRTVEEVAVINGITLDKAEQKLTSALNG